RNCIQITYCHIGPQVHRCDILRRGKCEVKEGANFEGGRPTWLVEFEKYTVLLEISSYYQSAIRGKQVIVDRAEATNRFTLIQIVNHTGAFTRENGYKTRVG